MRLFERMLEPATRLEQEQVADGEGGFYTHWQPAEEFSAACVCINTQQVTPAEKEQAQDTYTVTTTHTLAFGDVFVRLRDNKAFKVTSNGQEAITPEFATFSFKQYAAKAYELSEGENAY